MINLPEKIYVSPIGDNVHEAFVENPPTSVFGNCIEYIRKDVAEQMAKEFAMTCRAHRYHSVGELFTEFFNIRKK